MIRQTVKQGGIVAAAVLCALAIAPRIHAQQWAKDNLAKSPRHGEYVTIHEPGGRNLQAWVVYPEVKGKAPVVVMIHEIFGLSDWAREMADEVAAAGYIVVEPDLLSGLGPSSVTSRNLKLAPSRSTPYTGQNVAPVPHATITDVSGTRTISPEEMQEIRRLSPSGMGCDPLDCAPRAHPVSTTSVVYPAPPTVAHSQETTGQTGAPYGPATPGGTAAFPDQSAVIKAISSLPDPQVMADLDAAADYGKHLPAAGTKLFVTGFCWGGGKSFLFATHRHDLSAAFVFYGPPPPTDLMKDISAPVYGFYGALDARITSTVDGTKIDMKAAGKTYEPVIYDGAGHGFMRAGEAPDANAANSAARQAGFHRLINLLGGVR